VSNKWMRSTFPQGRFVKIDGGRHQLLNEAEPIREQVLDLICDELGR
jgi:alpha-beta hydrolase superfamily lysophospholipase